jgi:hypothetical protein
LTFVIVVAKEGDLGDDDDDDDDPDFSPKVSFLQRTSLSLHCQQGFVAAQMS